VIRLISENFVPVALNLYVIREDKGAAGEFFRKAQQQMPEQYQGLYLCSPEGKLLVKKTLWSKGGNSWSDSVLQGLNEGLQTFGPVKPRQGHSDYLARRGCGLNADGRAILSVSTKLLFVPQLPADLADLNSSAISATGHDRIILSAAELATLVPSQVSEANEGLKWAISEATARKFFPVLDNWDKRFREPSEVTAVHLAGKLRSVRQGIAYLNFEGNIAGTHIWPQEAGPALAGKSLRSEMKLLAGVGAYEVKAGKLLSLTLVFEGRAGDEAKLRTPGQDGHYGAIVEWRDERLVKSPLR
jgi:hypothetical protein